MALPDTLTADSQLQADFERFSPTTYLLDSANPSGIEDIYNLKLLRLDSSKPLVFVVIGPSGAGKDTLVDYLIEKGLVRKVVTATSRERRIHENEAEDAYVWMRPKRDDETDEEYYDHLVVEEDLVEHDGHHGSVYGLPRRNLVSDSELPSIIRTENKGLKTLVDKLSADYNVISIFVTPDSYEVLYNRIKDRNNVGLRMAKAVKEIEEAKNLVHFVVLNPDQDLEEKAAGQPIRAKVSIEQLVLKIAEARMEA